MSKKKRFLFIAKANEEQNMFFLTGYIVESKLKPETEKEVK